MSLRISKAEVGDIITLQRQDVEVVECDDCDHLMVNVDADELAPGDLVILKRKGVRISNPETEDEICESCEQPAKESFGSRLSSWFDDVTDDDDSSFFDTSVIGTSLGGGFGGSSGFGGFGGGSFSGGGASRSF